MSEERTPRVAIVGAGLAGLCCARRLGEAEVESVLFEAGDEVGGRVATEKRDGFTLDRGFQVLLTAYPECRRALDYEALDLRAFESGALVRLGGRFHRVADPFRHPLAGLATLAVPIGGLGDKLRVARLRLRLLGRGLDAAWSAPEVSTAERLRELGFSERMIDRFFRPFYGGIFLDRELATSSRMFEFLFQMFARGKAAVPAGGMGQIPRQLAAGLDGCELRLRTPVAAVAPRAVTPEGGAEERYRAVVVATDPATAAGWLDALETPAFNATTCHYYAAPEPPLAGRWLVLDGEGGGPINSLHTVTELDPSAAPEGQALVSVTELAATGSPAAVEAQLGSWFGAAVDGWRRLASISVPRALPAQPPGALEPPERPVRLTGGLYVCGDHRDNASIQGAMLSGRRAAEAVLEELAAGAAG